MCDQYPPGGIRLPWSLERLRVLKKYEYLTRNPEYHQVGIGAVFRCGNFKPLLKTSNTPKPLSV